MKLIQYCIKPLKKCFAKYPSHAIYIYIKDLNGSVKGKCNIEESADQSNIVKITKHCTLDSKTPKCYILLYNG